MIERVQNTTKYIKELDTKFDIEYNYIITDIKDDIKIIERTQLLETRYQYIILTKIDDNVKHISFNDFMGLLFFSLTFDKKIKGDPLEKWIDERNGL